MFAFGVGALSGSLGLAMLPNLRHVGKLMVLPVVVWHSSILVFAASQSFYLSMAILVVVGGGWASTQVFLLSALLQLTQMEYRGRVIGLRSLAIYAFALGSMSSGAMAGRTLGCSSGCYRCRSHGDYPGNYSGNLRPKAAPPLIQLLRIVWASHFGRTECSLAL